MLREFIEQLDKLPQKALSHYVSIDTDKPLIGIISAQNDLSASQSTLDNLAERVKEAVVACGANAKLQHVSTVDCAAIRGQSAKYDLPSRDLTANAVELVCSNEFFDGLVFVASESNVVAGMLIAAIRLNVPCAFVCGGVMSPIVNQRKEHGYGYFYELIAAVKKGKLTLEAASNFEANLPLAAGTDCARYDANSFNCVLEAVGLAVRGNGTATACSAERKTIAYKTGELICKLVEDKCTPRRLLTAAALTNIATLDLACGGSTTTAINLIAIAKELGVKTVTYKSIGDLAKTTPTLLCQEDANSCIMTQFHKAGGVYAMLKQLLDAKLIKGDVEISEGVKLQFVIDQVTVTNTNVIRSADNSVMPSSRLRAISGNVAESGAFAQYTGEPTFTGTAKVYANEEMAIDALLHREVNAGNVLVIRGEGPKSGPGMREIYATLALLKGFGLDDKVAVVTDGRIADACNGIVVGCVTPETGERNLFSVLQDGDEIEINVTKGKISCDIKAKDLAKRYRDSDASVSNYGNFYLKNWAKTCSTALDGCVYKAKK